MYHYGRSHARQPTILDVHGFVVTSTACSLANGDNEYASVSCIIYKYKRQSRAEK